MLELPKCVGEVGIDECGRGSLAGPVVAAAVVWDPKITHVGIRDSKKLSAKKRNEMSEFIKENAIDYSISFINSETIDSKNILQATYDAMHDSIAKLSKVPLVKLYVDGNRFRSYEGIPHTCVVKGDDVRVDIAAASILAKVARDEYMATHKDEMVYGWSQNSGYGTKKHIQAIKEHGPCGEHRRTFISRIWNNVS
jgi:ribonuclease HII